MKKVRQKFTLDQPATYQIKVPRQLDGSWADWAAGKTVTVENDEDGLPVTTLVGSFDQVALHGLLRRLYSMACH